MLEVENMSPFTRGFTVKGKEFIFRANQVRNDIPDYFLNPNGTIMFAGLLKLRRVINDSTGESKRVWTRRDENYQNGNQLWEFIFEKDGQTFITTRVTDFCEKNDLNVTSIRNYMKLGKLYKGWKISRRLLNGKTLPTSTSGAPQSEEGDELDAD